MIDLTRMTTFIKAKLKKSDGQMSIDKDSVAENITEYQKYVKMDVWTFWSQLSSFYAFYFVPNCIRNPQ